MQRGCVRVALAYTDEFNESAHWGCDAGNPASKSFVRKYADEQTGLSASRSGYKVEYAKQAGVVGPQFDEFKRGLASQRDETLWRVLVRMLGKDFFPGAKAKLSIAYVNCLIGRADQIHLDATGF